MKSPSPKCIDRTNEQIHKFVLFTSSSNIVAQKNPVDSSNADKAVHTTRFHSNASYDIDRSTAVQRVLSLSHCKDGHWTRSRSHIVLTNGVLVLTKPSINRSARRHIIHSIDDSHIAHIATTNSFQYLICFSPQFQTAHKSENCEH